MSAKTLAAGPGAVAGRTSQGLEVRGRLTHLNGSHLVFETSDPWLPLCFSEVLDNFRVEIGGREISAGRAVVVNALNNGASLLCEVSLSEGWLDPHLDQAGMPTEARSGKGAFNAFLRDWQSLYAVRPEYKIVLSDWLSFMTHFRIWLEAEELRFQTLPNGHRAQAEAAFLQEITETFVGSVRVMHERFETITASLAPEEHPAHESLCRRLLHSLFLCSPFAHRTFSKPLGYAGDYEMVNMILRSPYEGATLYAKAINVLLLLQYPAQAHRNRIGFLTQKLVEETVRVSLAKRPARIFSLGCGPAHEIQAFLRQYAVSDHAEFHLLDFNQETITHARSVLETVRREHGRECRFRFSKKSVISILKESVRAAETAEAEAYDLIYCAGLFDYLPDRTCQQLMGIFYQWLAPGGLLVATNVNPCQPFRHFIEYLLDWRLIYRDARQMQALVPAGVPVELARTVSDLTGTNLLLEVRKPAS